MLGIGPRGAVLAVLSLLLFPAAAAAAGPLHFSAPKLIDTQAPPGSQHAIEAIDCGHAALCVAFDDAGNLLTASDPTAPDAWLAHRGIDLIGTPQAVSCATVCVMVDSAGDIASSSSVGRTWKLVAGADPRGDLRAVNCPTRRFCVAVDGHGDVLSSTNPTGSKRAWHVRRVLSSRQALSAVACPTASVCVALYAHGFATTTDAARTWHTSAYPGHLRAGQSDELLIACPTRSLCVALVSGDSLHVLRSTDPGSARTWRSRAVHLNNGGARVTGLACPSASLCVGGDEFGNVVTGSARGTWRATKVLNHVAQPGAMVMACFRSGPCAGGDSTGIQVTSNNPGDPHPVWAQIAIDQSDAITGVSCTSATFCAAVDNAGNVLTSANPAGPAWAATHLSEPMEGLGSIDCIAPVLCVAGTTGAPVVQASTDPTGGAAAWHAAVIDNEAVEMNGVSCPSATLCVVADFGVYTDSSSSFSSIDSSTNPTGGDAAWVSTFDQATFQDLAVLEGISCPTTTLCVAVDDRGNVVTSTSPTSGHWQRARRDGKNAMSGISCPTASLCVAVDQSGNAVTSTNPIAGPWHTSAIDAHNKLTAVSCAGTSLCAAVDSAGNILTSTNPSGGTHAWQKTSHVDPDLSAVSCVAGPFCVIADSYGHVVVGTV